MHKTGLSEEVIEALGAIFRATPKIEEVIVFGSRAKGNFSEGSDIDLAIKGHDVNVDTILTLMNDIEILGLLYKVDVQNYQNVKNNDLKEHIDRVGKVLWRRFS
jgi:predicted nucleotidyltransferase